jgi:hypothetical protein
MKGRNMKSLTRVTRTPVKPLVIGLLAAIGAIYTAEAAQAGEVRSTIREVAVFPDHVHCWFTAGTKDGANDIYFLSIPTTDSKLVDRVLTVASTALVSGRKFIGGFDAGSTGGVPHCGADSCRKLTYFGIE